jgi:hypothetical protein
MDMKFAGPIIAKSLTAQATEDELGSINLASFPKNPPPDITKGRRARISREPFPSTRRVNNMEPKHKKILLICVAVFIGSYIVRSLVFSVMQMAYYRQQAIRAAQLRQWPRNPSQHLLRTCSHLFPRLQ